ncbi:hypothetical protein ES703_110001 [subsurface metagenome]
MNRCLNNIWGYCDDEPQPVALEEKVTLLLLGGQTTPQTFTTYRCRLDPASCSHFRSFPQVAQTLIARHTPSDA